MKYTIKPNAVGSDEKLIEKFDLYEFIEFSGLKEGYDDLNAWFDEYRYEGSEPAEGLPAHFNNSEKRTIDIDIDLPDGTSKTINIRTEGKTFEEERDLLLKNMSNGEILIEGTLGWTKGNWKSYTIETEKEIEFDKIIANIKTGLIDYYSYEGQENTDFEDNEDNNLGDGYPDVSAYVFWNNKLHQIDVDDLYEEIEDTCFDIDDEESGSLHDCIMKIFKEKYS